MIERTGAAALGVAVFCLALSSCGAGSAKKAGASAGSVPDFSLPSLEGETVHLSDYLGKNVILIDFWSTTRDPRMSEMPHLVDLYKKHKDRGFVVLAVSIDGAESGAQVSSVVYDKEMIFPSCSTSRRRSRHATTRRARCRSPCCSTALARS